MRWHLAVVTVLGLLGAAHGAGAPLPADLSAMPTEQLIDRITELDGETAGVASGGDYTVFMADPNEKPQFQAGLLPLNADVSVPPVLRELVRRGVAALPALIAHLRDDRLTKILAGGAEFNSGFGGEAFNSEYVGRDPSPRSSGCDDGDGCVPFEGTYTVAVGDICFVLIGQIVNRPFEAVRYQPTMILYVNSPVVMTFLAADVARDWSGLTADTLRASLLADLRRPNKYDVWNFAPALKRLRFYYPDTYRTLDGEDARRRDAWESYVAKYGDN